MSVPGLLKPTVSAMNGPNPQASAAAEGAATNQKLALMNNKLAGGKKKWRGGKGTIDVPQFQMSYTPQNGPNQDPNTQIKDLSAISTQAAANSVYDSQATKMGGASYRRKKRGGNPNWNWGCYSGGRRTRRKTKRNKKNKSRRHRKSRR